MPLCFGSIPTLFSASTAAPTANGLTVDPRHPLPAPNRTIADPTSGSIPAAIIVAASNA